MEGEQKVENQIKTFDIKTEMEALKKVKKLEIETADNFFSEEEILKMENVFVVDKMHVFAIIGKTIEAKLFLRRFMDKEYSDLNINAVKNISYICSNEEAINSCSAELLTKLLDFMQVFDDIVRIKVKKGCPAWLENEHFMVVLAPRIIEE